MKTNFIWKDWKEHNRQPCEIYTRTMWYFRPVSQWNTWKKAEFYSRVYYTQEATMNSKFINEYS